MQELGPFRVNSDNKTLSRNKNAWNNRMHSLLFLFEIKVTDNS